MKLHSIKLPHRKASAEMPTLKTLNPPKVVISMSQHGGVPCTPVVNVGDEVKTGQIIGTSEAAISAPFIPALRER